MLWVWTTKFNMATRPFIGSHRAQRPCGTSSMIRTHTHFRGAASWRRRHGDVVIEAATSQ